MEQTTLLRFFARGSGTLLMTLLSSCVIIIKRRQVYEISFSYIR